MYAHDIIELTKERVQHEIEELQKAYVAGDEAVRERVDNIEKIQEGAPTERQALRVVSKKYGFHNWNTFRSYLELDGCVRKVIDAVRFGDLDGLQKLLEVHPEAANPLWPERGALPKPIPNDSIPLFMVCIGLIDKTNTMDNTYDLVKALLCAGADPDIENSMPLNGAASFNCVEIAEALLDGGAKIDGANDDGWPLALALFFGWDVAKVLEQRGAKLDLRSASGLGRLDVMASFFKSDGTLTPEAGALRLFGSKEPEYSHREILAQSLVSACMINQVEAVEFLLDKGADIDAMPSGFDYLATGLHRAINRGHVEVAKLLIGRGADVTLKDDRSESTALEWAEKRKLDEIADLIRQRGDG